MTTKPSELAYDLPPWHSRPSPLRDRTLSQLSVSPYGTIHVNSSLAIRDYKQTNAGPDLSLTVVAVAATDTKTELFQMKQSSGRSYDSLGLGSAASGRERDEVRYLRGQRMKLIWVWALPTGEYCGRSFMVCCRYLQLTNSPQQTS